MGKKLSGINKVPLSCYQTWRAGPFIPNSISQRPFPTRDLGVDLGTDLGGILEGIFEGILEGVLEGILEGNLEWNLEGILQLP